MPEYYYEDLIFRYKLSNTISIQKLNLRRLLMQMLERVEHSPTEATQSKT
jgi:hypothetical protein